MAGNCPAPAGTILCAGESLIDMLPCETAGGEPAFLPRPGGSVFNTAVALGRLGERVALLSGVSTDLFGEGLCAALEASRVSTEFLIRSDRPTTLAFVAIEAGEARYAFHDENTAGRMISPRDLPAPGTGIAALFLGGISLASEPCADAYEALARRLAPEVPVMLDPNIRPGFAPDAARYRARLHRLIAIADIVKLSGEDLDWLAGPGETRARVHALRALGPKLVFVTHGAEGATGFSATDEIFLPARPVRVADTVGAGDTFNAGVLAALAETGLLRKPALAAATGAALEACLRLGTEAAAIAVSRAGANPPWKSEVTF